MKIYEKIRTMRVSKGWTQEEMADKLNLSVNGYANIERGETDVQYSRLEQIANLFGIELLELISFGERNVFYWTGDNNNFDHFCKNIQSIDFSEEKKELEYELDKARLLLEQREQEMIYKKKELEHELDKTCLLLEQREQEIAYLKEIIELMKKSGGR